LTTQPTELSGFTPQTLTTTLEPNDATHLATLCGQFDAHLKQVENRLNVAIASRGNRFTISGNSDQAEAARDLLEALYAQICAGEGLSAERLHIHMQDAGLEVLQENRLNPAETAENVVVIKTKRAPVKPRGKNQQGYVRAIQDFDINFGIGPAGTGKTYLAVACAVEALLQERVRRILLVRPAVEAGEKLGFLPGDLAQKN
jgi:phosphate starvation-inducible PhoH-like protein